VAALEADHAVRTSLGCKLALVQKVVEVGNSLTHCKEYLVPIQFTTEQDWQHVCRTRWLRASGEQFGQALIVMFRQLHCSASQPVKW